MNGAGEGESRARPQHGADVLRLAPDVLRLAPFLTTLFVASACLPGTIDGDSVDGEGDVAEVLRVGVEVLRFDGVTALSSDVGLPLAFGTVAGAPTLVAAELDDAGMTGALLLHSDVLGDRRVARIDDAFARGDSRATAIIADLDGDGDNDVVVNASFEVVMLLDDGSGFTAASIPITPTTSQMAAIDLDGDGSHQVVIAGLNGDFRAIDALAATPTNRRFQVGELFYCARSFAAHVDLPLLMRGDVCGGTSVDGAPVGADRLFALDANFEVIASVDLGIEELFRTPTVVHDGFVYVSGGEYVASLDRVGDAAAVRVSFGDPVPGFSLPIAVVDKALWGIASLDGGEPKLVVSGFQASAVQDAIALDFLGDHAPLIADIDGDGLDDIVVTEITLF